ncbi:hypothetical protein ACFQX6_08670 [Streptosporangium lutulentum]
MERYFCLGTDAAETAEAYVAHYYGAEYLPRIRPDVLTDGDRLREEIDRLAEAGADDLVLFPCSGAPEQIGLLSDALDKMGVGRAVGAVSGVHSRRP